MQFCKADAKTLRLNTRCYELTPRPSTLLLNSHFVRLHHTAPFRHRLWQSPAAVVLPPAGPTPGYRWNPPPQSLALPPAASGAAATARSSGRDAAAGALRQAEGSCDPTPGVWLGMTGLGLGFENHVWCLLQTSGWLRSGFLCLMSNFRIAYFHTYFLLCGRTTCSPHNADVYKE